MTNKDKIQAAHFSIIRYGNGRKWEQSADKCTTITVEAIGEYEKWKDKLVYDQIDNTYFIKEIPKWASGYELPELFLNQKAKI